VALVLPASLFDRRGAAERAARQPAAADANPAAPLAATSRQQARANALFARVGN
jgi:hypothetical protein